ncbi:MAG: phosphatidylglycerol lysyltransferase domain-containing protein [Candidatus Aminicenantes bacterium]|nr:phosphatidylglycerol lysyltransferase domain-containing protein [Candidatus Aminicenantes bacterium]
MSHPVYPEFKPVGLEDQALLRGYLEREPSGVCEMNFANIFIWKDSEHPRYTILDGSLCILVEPDFEPPYFLPPVGGDRVPETIAACLRHAPRLSRVPEEFVRRFGAGFRAEEDPDNFDYLYRVEDLVELKGKKYDGKRNRIRKFESTFSHEYAALARGDVAGCVRLLEHWFEEKRNGDPYMKAEKVAIVQALASFELLALKGGVVKVDGRIEAFTFGMRLSEDTAVIPIEIANPAFAGLAQWINREFVRREWPDCKFVNREQDMGVEGLRKAKLSYQPDHLARKYNLTSS